MLRAHIGESIPVIDALHRNGKVKFVHVRNKDLRRRRRGLLHGKTGGASIAAPSYFLDFSNYFLAGFCEIFGCDGIEN
jgi:hypothetical protein